MLHIHVIYKNISPAKKYVCTPHMDIDINMHAQNHLSKTVSQSLVTTNKLQLVIINVLYLEDFRLKFNNPIQKYTFLVISVLSFNVF